MPKAGSEFICQQCGAKSASFLGRCPQCGAWNSFQESVVVKSPKTAITSSIDQDSSPLPLSEVVSKTFGRISTGFSELDRVLGGGSYCGIVPGSVILLAGEPGIGKSTLLLQTAMNLSLGQHFQDVGKNVKINNKHKTDLPTVLYVSAEESPEQIKLRADRLGTMPDNLLVMAEIDVDRVARTIKQLVEKTRIKRSMLPGDLVVIVDSIQTIATEELSGVPGSIGQVRESALRLVQIAKKYHIPMILVGHVTKEGGIAGPKVLEHLVDVVLWVEGSRDQTLRLVRGVKNRFGATDEVGIFEMTDRGMQQVVNPSALFLHRPREPVAGSAVTCVVEGSQVLLVEIQALVVPTSFGLPRRVATGVDYNRLQVLLAVLGRHGHLKVDGFDVYVNVAGGLVIKEPAVDLAIVLSVASSVKNIPINQSLATFGEVGLLGEVRPVSLEKKRISQAKQLGFTQLITPQVTPTIQSALAKVFV